MDNKYIVFGAPMIGENEISEVVDSIRSGWLGTGPKVGKFEDMVKSYTGAKYAVALNSCTAGLHLAMLANDIGAGDEVITTPFTFCATINAIIHSGARPILVDIDKKTLNMDIGELEAVITDKTKAIIPVHMAGRPCAMNELKKIADKYDLKIIEDAAHAMGAKYNDISIGNFSDITCFSFYVTKNIVTGEGGMITTNDKELADKIKIYALHGMSKDAWHRYSDDGYKHYDVVYPGYKYNMMDIQAAIGIHQMKSIDRFQRIRDYIWERYNQELSDTKLILPEKIDNQKIKHAKHLYTIIIDEDHYAISRNELMQKMHLDGIGTGIHFYPVHLYSYYQQKYGWRRGDFPASEYVGERILSIPLSAKLRDQDVSRVCLSIKNSLK